MLEGGAAELDGALDEGVRLGPESSDRPEIASHPGAARAGRGSAGLLLDRLLWRDFDDLFLSPFPDVDGVLGRGGDPASSTRTESLSMLPSFTLTS